MSNKSGTAAPGDHAARPAAARCRHRRDVLAGPVHRHRQPHRAARAAARPQRLPAAAEPGLQHRRRQRAVRAGLGGLACRRCSRKTSPGVPRYRDARRPTSGHLRPVRRRRIWSRSAEPEPGVTRFRPRTEGLFARIERVRRRRRRHLAGQQPGRAGQPLRRRPARPAVVADPADRRRVFGWKLTETTDPFGNRIATTTSATPAPGPPARGTSSTCSRSATSTDVAAGPASWSRSRSTTSERPGPVLRLPRRLRGPDPAALPPDRGPHARRHEERLVRTLRAGLPRRARRRAASGRPPSCRRTGRRCSAGSGSSATTATGPRSCRRWSSATPRFEPERQRFQPVEADRRRAAAALAGRPRPRDWSTCSATACPTSSRSTAPPGSGATSAAAGSTVPQPMAEAPAGVHLRRPRRAARRHERRRPGRPARAAPRRLLPAGFAGPVEPAGFVRYPTGAGGAVRRRRASGWSTSTATA